MCSLTAEVEYIRPKSEADGVPQDKSLVKGIIINGLWPIINGSMAAASCLVGAREAGRGKD
jgi:hypothetical protein